MKVCVTTCCTNDILLAYMYALPDLIEPIGWEAQQIPKGVKKAALFYVEQAVTVHFFFCFTCTCKPKYFYWLVVHLAIMNKIIIK